MRAAWVSTSTKPTSLGAKTHLATKGFCVRLFNCVKGVNDRPGLHSYEPTGGELHVGSTR